MFWCLQLALGPLARCPGKLVARMRRLGIPYTKHETRVAAARSIIIAGSGATGLELAGELGMSTAKRRALP
jgi:NADH dehydrogenase FAD-containing subunit